MKKKVIWAILVVLFVPGMMQSQNQQKVSQKTQDTRQVQTKKSVKQPVSKKNLNKKNNQGVEKQKSAQQVQKELDDRIQKLRKKIAFTEIKTPRLVLEVTIEYFTLRLTQLFEPLVDRIADVIKDESSKRAFKKIPRACADGIILTSHLISNVATKEYLDTIKALKNPLECLLASKNDRAARVNNKGEPLCKAYLTQREAFKEIFKMAQPFIMPIVQVMVTGIQVNDKKIDGIVVNAIDIIVPSLLNEAKFIAEIFELVLNMFDQFEKGIQKTN